MFRVGEKKRFNHPQKGIWELKEIIVKPDLDLDWSWFLMDCPHCGKRIVRDRTYKLEKLFIWENDKQERFVTSETEPVTKDGKPLHLRLPDKRFYADRDMTDKIRAKSGYLKGKEV